MRFLTILSAVLVLSAGQVSAQLAETYQVEAGRLTGLGSSVAVAITDHGANPAGVWLATGHGVSYSFDQGVSWYVNNSASGLPADNLSAIFSLPMSSGPGRIWVASNHSKLISGLLTTLSDGLSYSDDNGDTWTTLDFSPSGLNIPYVIGGDRITYDLTGHHDVGFLNNLTNDTTDWMFAASFAGGLLASQDGGIHWRRIYASRSDSIQYNTTTQAPSLRNLYFSCVADTSHGDSLFLWTGTAAGIFQYVFAPPREKLYSRWINRLDIASCDTCPAGEGSRVFIGGRSGLSLASTLGGAIQSRFAVDGLPIAGTDVVSVFSIGDKLLAGTVKPNTDSSTGMVVSADGGQTFELVAGQPTAFIGNDVISDFAKLGGRVYAAVQSAGLYVSPDSGSSWSKLPLDLLYTSDALLTANSVSAAGDTLFVGTDSGLVQLTLDPTGDIVGNSHVPFVDSDSSGARIVRIRRQVWDSHLHDTLTPVHDEILWTVHQPLSASGRSMVGRFGPELDTIIAKIDTPTVIPLHIDTTYALDTLGFSWRHFRIGADVYDVNFFGDTTFFTGENSIMFTPRIAEPTNFFYARQLFHDTLVVDNLDNDTVTTMEVRGDTVIFGCSNGIAISNNRGANFVIYRANRDTLSADFVVNHSYLTSLGGLAGDFVPSLGVQYRSGQPARIWAGCRPADFGDIGISYGEYDTAGILNWQTVFSDDFAWNFEFLGDTALAATNVGLLLNNGVLDSLNTDWGTVSLTDPTGQVLVEPGTAAYGLSLVDSNVWVGTDGGTVRLSRNELVAEQLYKRVDSTTPSDEIYAFPVPFRPGLGQTVDFHFVVKKSANVTVSVYDFAMNLVATPIDNVYLEAGIYPPADRPGSAWNGYNDKGDLVAVGVYYFKIEDGSGESRWGKLAVIP